MDARQACVEALAIALARLERGQRRNAEPGLAPSLAALQAWQSQRLAAEYADQRALPRRRAAVDFFLEEVYGAHDFSERDAQFARAIHRLPAMLPLPALQGFIERDYAAFRQLGPEAAAFLATVGEREEAFRQRSTAPLPVGAVGRASAGAIR